MQFYEKIRELREDNDLKQETMAHILGVGQSYYSKQERGLKPFQVEQIITICNYFKVSADYILGIPKNYNWPRG